MPTYLPFAYVFPLKTPGDLTNPMDAAFGDTAMTNVHPVANLPQNLYDSCVQCAEAGKAKKCSGAPVCDACNLADVKCDWLDAATTLKAKPIKKESRKEADARVAKAREDHAKATADALAQGLPPPPPLASRGRPKAAKAGTSIGGKDQAQIIKPSGSKKRKAKGDVQTGVAAKQVKKGNKENVGPSGIEAIEPDGDAMDIAE